MKNILVLIIILLGFNGVYAADAGAGKAKYQTCVACHGTNGVSTNPIYPNVKGQHAAYTVAQLKAFKDGTRKGANSAQMTPFSLTLSDADIENIAAYLEGLKN